LVIFVKYKVGTKANVKIIEEFLYCLQLTNYFPNILKNRINEYLEDEMAEEQCGFREERSYTDAIFTVQQIMGKRKEHNLPLFLLFIDNEKAYDNVNRDKLWEMMDNKFPNYLLNTIKFIYRNTKIRIKFNDGISEPIHINRGVRVGCGL